MKPRDVFCSACDRDVRVLMTDAGHDDAQANVHDPEVVCLEIGSWCSGNLCPLGAAEPNAMVARLIRSGMSLEHLTMARGFCAACNLESDLALYGKDMAACVVCGTSQSLPRSGERRPMPPEAQAT
ncbi:MAG: hypothetical protein U0132_23670 [Gemmatimonadaceae bacterium]